MSARWGGTTWGTSQWAAIGAGTALTGADCIASDRLFTACVSGVVVEGGEVDVANEYVLGNVIRVDGSFKSNGVSVNPGSVSGRIKTPSGAIVTFTQGDNLVSGGVGAFYFTYTPTEEGRHEYRIAGSGTNIAADEGHFIMVESRFN